MIKDLSTFSGLFQPARRADTRSQSIAALASDKLTSYRTPAAGRGILLVLLTVLRRLPKSVAHLHSKINEKAQISLSSTELESQIASMIQSNSFPTATLLASLLMAVRNSPLLLKIPISHEFAYSLGPHFVTTESNI